MENSNPNSEVIVSPTDIEGGDNKSQDQVLGQDGNPQDNTEIVEKQDEDACGQAQINHEIVVVNEIDPSGEAAEGLESQDQGAIQSKFEVSEAVHSSEINHASSSYSVSSVITTTKITTYSSSIQQVQTSNQSSGQLEIVTGSAGFAAVENAASSEHQESQEHTSDVQAQFSASTQEQQQLTSISEGAQMTASEKVENIEEVAAVEDAQGKTVTEVEEVASTNAGKDDIIQGGNEEGGDQEEQEVVVVEESKEEENQDVKATQEQEEQPDEQGIQGGQQSDVDGGDQDKLNYKEEAAVAGVEIVTSNQDQAQALSQSSSSHVAQVVEVVTSLSSSSQQRIGSQMVIQGGQVVIEGQVDASQGQLQQQQEQQQQSVAVSSSSNIQSEIRHSSSSQVLKTSQIITTTTTTTTTTRRIVTADGGSYVEQSSQEQTQQQQQLAGGNSGLQVEEVHETVTEVVNTQVQDQGQQQQMTLEEQEHQHQQYQQQETTLHEESREVAGSEEQSEIKRIEVMENAQTVEVKQEGEQVQEEEILAEERQVENDEENKNAKQEEGQEIQDNAGQEDDAWEEENVEGEERAFEEGSRQHQKEQSQQEEGIKYEYDDYQQQETYEQSAGLEEHTEGEKQQGHEGDYQEEEEEAESQETQNKQEESIYEEQLTKRRVLIEQVSKIEGFPQELLVQLQTEEQHFEEELTSLKSQRQQLRVIALAIQQREADLAAVDADYTAKKEQLEEEKSNLADVNAIKEYVERKELDLKDREREIQASLEFLKEKDNLIAKKEAEIEERIAQSQKVNEEVAVEQDEEQEEKVKGSKENQSKCPQCQSDLTGQGQSELLEQISALSVQLQEKNATISSLQMQLVNQQTNERDISGYEELLKESRVMSESLRQTRLESDSKQSRIQELEERLHFATTQLSAMQEQLSQVASEKQKLISTIETQTLQCTQLQSKLRIQASDEVVKSSNQSQETNNYQDIIADLRDTIGILNSENDEYRLKLENLEKANHQLIGSFREIKSQIGGQKSIQVELEVLQAKYDAAARALEEKDSESKTYEQKVKIVERQLEKLQEERLIEQKLVEDERNELLQVKDWENQQINSDYNNRVKILEEQLLEKDNHATDQASAYQHEITQLKMQLRVIMEKHVLMQKKYEARSGLDQEEQEKAMSLLQQQLSESNEQLQISKQLLQQQQTQSAQQQLQDAQLIADQQEELRNQGILASELQRRLKEMNDNFEEERVVSYERNVKIEFQEEEWRRRDTIIESQNLKISELIRANESYQIEITLLLGRLTASENKTEKLISELDQVNQKYTVQILGLSRETQANIAALQAELTQSKSDYARAEAGRVQAVLAAETAESKLALATTKIGQLELTLNELKETSFSSEKRLRDQLFDAEKKQIQLNEAAKAERDSIWSEYNSLLIIHKEYELKILSFERDTTSRIESLQELTSRLNSAEDLIASLTKQNAQLNEQIQILSRDLEETRKQCLLFQNDAENHQIRADSMIKENQTGLRIENEELKAEVIKLTDRINELSDGYQNFYETTRKSQEKMEADKESISLALISKDQEVKQQQADLDQCRVHIATLSEQLNSKDKEFNEQQKSLYSDIRQLVLERDTARSAEQSARLVAIDGQSSKSSQLQEQVKALLQELDRQEDALKEATKTQLSLKQELASSQQLIEKQASDIRQLESIMSNQSNHIKTLDARLQGQEDSSRLNEENILLRREIDQKLRESDIKVQTIMNEKKTLEFKLLDAEAEHTTALRENSLKLQAQYEALIANQLAKIEDLTQSNQRLAYLKSSQIGSSNNNNNGSTHNLNGLASSGIHNSYTNTGNYERNTPKKTIELLPPRSLRPGRESSPYAVNTSGNNVTEQLSNGSFRANSPSNQVSVTSALALAAGHASNSGLDQAYNKCLQRSKNLLNRNESILSTLKAANSLDRSDIVINTSWNNNNNGAEKTSSQQLQQQQQQVSNSSLLNNSIASSSSRVTLSTPKVPLYIKKVDSERPPFLSQPTEQQRTTLTVSEHLRSSPAVQNNNTSLKQASSDFGVTSAITTTTTTTSNMPQYQGERLGNLRHGRGRCFYPNGEVYEGEWKSDKRHGYGILRDSNGEIYNGDWEFDLYHGQGRLRNKLSEPLSKEFDYTNFELLRNQWVSYSGEFKNHSLHGLGTLILSNGEKFLGSFSGGKVHGEGTFYRQTGDIEVGYWQNNKFIGKL